MSGPDASETPPEIPEEFAAAYAEAYRRALEDGPAEPTIPAVEEGEELFVLREEPSGDVTPRWILPAIAAAAALVLIVGAYLVGGLFGTEEEPAAEQRVTPTPTRSANTTPTRKPKPTKTPTAKPAPGAFQGPIEEIRAEKARASCRARASIDSAGRKVRYGAPNTLDDDPETAWRCDGEAGGVTLTFTFDDDVEIAEVGLVPGYAKTDPASGADRYAENNRITLVRWTLADGIIIDQVIDADPKRRDVQTMRVPRTETDRITLEILAVEKGPRNTTAISTATFAAPA